MDVIYTHSHKDLKSEKELICKYFILILDILLIQLIYA